MVVSVDELEQGVGMRLSTLSEALLTGEGVMLRVTADAQTRGTLFDVSALGLTKGSAVKLTSGNKVVDLSTQTSFLSSGAVRISADSLQKGSVWKISSDDFHIHTSVPSMFRLPAA